MSVTTDNLITALVLEKEDLSAEELSALNLYLESAILFIKNAICSDDAFLSDGRVSSLVDLATVSLACNYWTYRIPVSQINAYQVPLTTNSIVGQVRAFYDVYLEEQNG